MKTTSASRLREIISLLEQVLRDEASVDISESSKKQTDVVLAHYKNKHPTRGRGVTKGHRLYVLIESRLAEGFSVDELKLAIDGNLQCPWHKENSAGHGLEFIFRNSQKVEQFIEQTKKQSRETGNHSGSREFEDGEAEF